MASIGQFPIGGAAVQARSSDGAGVQAGSAGVRRARQAVRRGRDVVPRSVGERWAVLVPGDTALGRRAMRHGLSATLVPGSAAPGRRAEWLGAWAKTH